MENTQKKLQKLLDNHTEYRPDFLETISKAEKDLRDAIQVKQFGENDIMKKIRRKYAKDIHEINEVLLYKEDIPERKRERLFDKRKMLLSFLQIFSVATLTIQNIDKWVNSEFTDEEVS